MSCGVAWYCRRPVFQEKLLTKKRKKIGLLFTSLSPILFTEFTEAVDKKTLTA